MTELVGTGGQYGPVGISHVSPRVWEVIQQSVVFVLLLLLVFCWFCGFSFSFLSLWKFSYKLFSKYLYGMVFTVVFRILVFTLVNIFFILFYFFLFLLQQLGSLYITFSYWLLGWRQSCSLRGSSDPIQMCASNVQVLFSLRGGGGAMSGRVRELGCPTRVVW